MQYPSALVAGSSKLVGLIGNPVAHSLSPLIHNFSFSQLGIDAVYIPFELRDVNTEGLRSFLSLMTNSNFVGFNVTLPYKELVADVCSADTPSVNTVSRSKSGSWTACSSDGVGFLRAVERASINLTDYRQVVCIGNGGAAFSAVESWAKIDPTMTFHILSRTRRDELWCQRLEGCDLRFADLGPRSLQRALAESAPTLLLQASSAPLHGDNLDELAENLPNFEGSFLDMVYGHPSALYSAALAAGVAAQDGKSMLIEQARVSQEVWFGQSLDFDRIASCLAEHADS